MPTNPLRLEQVKNPIIRRFIQKMSGLGVLCQWYDDWLLHGVNPDRVKPADDADAFIDYTLGRLSVGADIVNMQALEDLPRDGSLVIVANHPLGGLEGMLLTQILRRLRPDLKVLTNEMLKMFPEFEDVFIGVDVLNPNKQKENARGLRDVARHLSQGGALLVFPAGTVSHLYLPSCDLADVPWDTLVSRLARKYKAPILPMFVGARNTIWFYLSAYIHPRLRTMLLPRAMIKRSGRNVPVHVGALIPPADLQRIPDDDAATHYVRLCCEVLDDRDTRGAARKDIMNHAVTLSASVDDTQCDVAGDVARDLVVAHLRTLDDCLLHRQHGFSLYVAPYDRLGVMMEQIAIEREKTFRQVDEGTGRSLDCDGFDPHYQHLFLWDEEKKKIAGGYRIGMCDDIVRTYGLDGLYSHSLFDYDQRFLDKMGKAIEVGRSFISPDYQRHPRALDMLWKGIGRFIARNPAYHTLFGCVSISRQYSPVARTLLSDTFLYHYGAEEVFKRDVKARTPAQKLVKPWTHRQISGLSDIPIINKLLGRIDSGKSIPVLIRHYLALNGRFISFTVNEGFNDSLDGLIMVDLRDAPDKYIARYMGEDGFHAFKKKWYGCDVT